MGGLGSTLGVFVTSGMGGLGSALGMVVATAGAGGLGSVLGVVVTAGVGGLGSVLGVSFGVEVEAGVSGATLGVDFRVSDFVVSGFVSSLSFVAFATVAGLGRSVPVTIPMARPITSRVP